MLAPTAHNTSLATPLARPKLAEADAVDLQQAQYTDDEYKMRRTWGHSTFSDVVALAAKAQVKQLALTHHDPAHTDAMMDRFVAECQEVIKRQEQPMTCFAAQEGLTLNL